MEDFPKTNKLIPELLNNSKDILKNLYGRMKANLMLDEFSNDANKDFKKIISFSTTRYRSTKTGNKIDGVLKSQKKEIEEFAKKVKDGDIYNNTKEINHEKDKLNKNMNLKKKQEITDIRDKIKISTKFVSSKELADQNKKLAKIKDTRISYLPKEIQQRIEREKKRKEEEERKKMEENKGIFFNYEGTEKELIDELLNHDKDTFKNLDDNYKQYLERLSLQVKVNEERKRKEMLERLKNKDEVPQKKTRGDDYERFDLRNYPQIKNINILYFKDKKFHEQEKKKSVEDTVNFQRLFRFTKKGKNFIKNLKYKKDDQYFDEVSSSPQIQSEPKLYGTENVVKSECSGDLIEKFDGKAKIFNEIIQREMPFIYDNVECKNIII